MNILFHTFPIGWLHYLPLAFFPSTCVQHCNILNDNRLTFFLNSSIHANYLNYPIRWNDGTSQGYFGKPVSHTAGKRSSPLSRYKGPLLTEYIPSTGHGVNMGQSQRLQYSSPLSMWGALGNSLTLLVHWLFLCNPEITMLPPFKQSAGGIKIPRLSGVKSLDDEVSALSK